MVQIARFDARRATQTQNDENNPMQSRMGAGSQASRLHPLRMERRLLQRPQTVEVYSHETLDLAASLGLRR
ncbi:MAG TPA: hypothetical protein VIZ90_09155, partial [Rhizobiaceae bacterium]